MPCAGVPAWRSSGCGTATCDPTSCAAGEGAATQLSHGAGSDEQLYPRARHERARAALPLCASLLRVELRDNSDVDEETHRELLEWRRGGAGRECRWDEFD